MISNQKSIIFHNDISYPRHKVDHINIEQIKQKQNIFLEKNTNIFQKNSEELKNSFWLWEASKYFSKRDTFIYEVLEEVEEVVDVCNAMSLVHNKDHIFIYQNEKHIHDAERKILEKGIFRIEDYS